MDDMLNFFIWNETKNSNETTIEETFSRDEEKNKNDSNNHNISK